MSDPSKPWGIAVYAIVRDPEGRVLLLQRSASSAHYAGKWEFPGGKQDAGESVDATVVRETREEAGIDIRVTGLAGVLPVEMPEVHVAMLFFDAVWLGGELHTSAEHTQSMWAQPEALARLELRPQVAEFLRQRPLR